MGAERILVIDDDPDFISYVRIVLETNGYLVETAASLKEGLDALQRLEPDLVISDVMLARAMNGLSITQAIKGDQRLAHIPILMVSAVVAEDEQEILGSATDEMPNAFLSKPISPAELLAQAAEMIRNAALCRRNVQDDPGNP